MTEEMFGRYRLEKLIGRGGMGEVHRAYDTEHQRVVALKRLPTALAGDPTFQARFRSEAALAARLHEPHVIRIHDYGEIDGRLYIDMRLVDGPDLATLLARHGPLPPDRAVAIITQIAAALDAAHAAGLVHRDIKPGNILLTEPQRIPGADPDATIAATRAADFVYVADFGIARATDTATTGALTSTGTTVGSLDYVAPERFGTGHGDHRADIYALGCLLHEALTAQRPFPVQGLPAIINAHLNTPPPRPTTLRPELPPALDAVVACAMAKDPDQRYRSAGALATAAHHALRGVDAVVDKDLAAEAITQRPVDQRRTAHAAAPADPVRASAGRSPRRRYAVVLAALATLAVLSAAAVTTQLLKPGSEQNTVRAEPLGSPGANPFMPPVTTQPPPPVPPVGTHGQVSGSTPGLYGGTLNNASCNPGQMVSFLQSHPDRAQAWADAEGITTAELPSYIGGLTPVVLRADTAVTNHGFAGGRATAVNSVLQAGTAVLVDRYGVPRARCYCGNPLTPPAALPAPAYVGPRWSSFNPTTVIVIVPAPIVLTQLTIVDPVKLVVFTRPVGSAGRRDRPEATRSGARPVGPPDSRGPDTVGGTPTTTPTTTAPTTMPTVTPTTVPTTTPTAIPTTTPTAVPTTTPAAVPTAAETTAEATRPTTSVPPSSPAAPTSSQAGLAPSIPTSETSLTPSPTPSRSHG